MSDEPPVEPDEFVLRRVHRNNFNGGLPVPIKRCEFEPKERDEDGLSVYRERILSAQQLVEAAVAQGRSAGDFYVARIKVEELLKMGLTVVPTVGDLPGHASIPELSYAAFRADKKRSKEIQLALAGLASRDICLRPRVEGEAV
jgi:hypothetical protein